MRLWTARSAGFLCVAALSLCQTAEPGPQQRRLRADLEFLCSDALAGRVSLSPQAEIAARCIAAAFQNAGLEPANGGSYLQEFPLIAYRSDPGRRAMTLTRGSVSKQFRAGS